MQNMMLQLNVPGKMIQQTQTQSSARPGKTGKKDNDFRDLLENSSGKDVAKDAASKKADEDQPAATEVKDKADESQNQDVQDSTVKKPDSSGKKEEADADADAEGQALSFLALTNGNLENLQVITPAQNAWTQAQPKTGGAQTLAVDVLAGEAQTELIPEEIAPMQAGTENLGIAQETPGDEAVVFSQTSNGVQSSQQAKKLQNHEASEAKTGKEAVHFQRQETAVKMPQQTGTQEKQGESISAGEDMEGFHAQTYAAETVFRQEAFGIQAQQGMEAQPMAHIQAESPQELMNQLMDQLKAKVVMANQEFEIQIHPENLGKLAIKVACTLEKVSISIVCTNERTMEMLSAGAKNIAQIMEENLGAPTTVVVEHGEDNYLEQYNNQENSRQRQQEEQQEKRQAQKEDHPDFLQQLRLGLI